MGADVRFAARRYIRRPLADIERGMRPSRLSQKLDDGAQPSVALDQNNVARLERAADHRGSGAKKGAYRAVGC